MSPQPAELDLQDRDEADCVENATADDSGGIDHRVAAEDSGGIDHWEAPEAEWVYLDDDGAVQGPFSTSELQSWVEMGYLSPSRSVNIAGGALSDFRPLGEWAELAIGKAATATVTADDESLQTSTADDKSLQTKALAAPDADAVASTKHASVEEVVEEVVDAWWFVDDNGSEQGPYPLAKLCSWVRRGLLQGERLVRGPGTNDQLQKIASCPQLSDVVDAAVAVGLSTSSSGAQPTQSASASAAAAAAASGCDDAAAELWEYRDDRLKTQGPFTARKLLGWIQNGHLKPSRMARRVSADGHSGGDFVPLSSARYFADALAAGALPAAPSTVASVGDDAGTLETPLWFYMDAQAVEQGPFAASQMQAWLTHGYLQPTTHTRHLSEPSSRRRPISEVALLARGHNVTSQATLHTGGMPHQFAPAGPQQSPWSSSDGLAPTATRTYEEYSVVGGFSTTSGRFNNPETAGENYWASKGIPKHRDERQMGHYFDLGSWQDEMNARGRRPGGKRKLMN